MSMTSTSIGPNELSSYLQANNQYFLNRWSRVRQKLGHLTHREHEVLRLLGLGLDNRQIAKTLEVTERTSRLHVSSILEKLGLESRLQAGLVYAEHAARRELRGKSDVPPGWTPDDAEATPSGSPQR